jgi:adenylylsulfate kinase
MIVLMAGLPGTGKTTLARELATRTGGRVLNKDEIRRAIFLPEEIEYSTRQDDSCLSIMLGITKELFERERNRLVLLDGRTFSRRYQINQVLNAAASLHQSPRIVECVCSEEIARLRLQRQSTAGSHPATNRNFELYLEVKSRFETITLPKIVIDTEKPLSECVEQALAFLC